MNFVVQITGTSASCRQFLCTSWHSVVCVCMCVGHTGVPCINGRIDQDAIWGTLSWQIQLLVLFMVIQSYSPGGASVLPV